MVTRRRLLITATLGAALPSLTLAQRRQPKIGMLSTLPLNRSIFAPVVVSRLGELGYRDGKTMTFEFRAPASPHESAATQAAELAAMKCDLIFVVSSDLQLRSLKSQNVSAPVVFLAADYDPVEKGFIASFARPGGNMTGVVTHAAELAAKRVEILKEIIPGAQRFLVLTDRVSMDMLPAIEKAARQSGVTLIRADISGPADLEGAFAKARERGAEGLVLAASPLFSGLVKRIAELARLHRLPAIGFPGTAETGFLLTYSSDNRRLASRMAEMGVQILKGASPGTMPVEQPSEFILVVNLSTARDLGIKVPYSVIARATKVID